MGGMTEVRKGKRTIKSVSVGIATAVQIAADNVNRKALIIQNQGTQNVFIGPSSVTISGATVGYCVFSGYTFTDEATDQEWWAISATSANILSIMEIS